MQGRNVDKCCVCSFFCLVRLLRHGVGQNCTCLLAVAAACAKYNLQTALHAALERRRSSCTCVRCESQRLLVLALLASTQT